MPRLFGRELSEYQVRERVGSIEQVGGVERMILAEGSSAGVEAFRVRTGGGLDFTVLGGRGMDIGAAEYRGYPLAWVSGTGPAHSAFFEPEGLGWLRTFHGGLVCTCGLTWAGAPATDGDQQLGLHGRVSHIPARHLSSGGRWRDGQYIIFAEGEMRETSVFGPDVLMRRTVTSVLGEPRIQIDDVVTNDGFAPQEHMIIYHCNLGFPLMGPDAELVTPASQVVGRDEYSQSTIARWARFSDPQPGVEERVYYHDLKARADGMTVVAVVNRGLGEGLALYFEYDRGPLWNMSQWKMPGQSTFVLGIEPANCHVQGRPFERDRGTLQVLEPGETREHKMTIGVAEGRQEIDQLVKSIKAI